MKQKMKFFQFDKAVWLNFIGRAVAGLTGPISLALIVTKLSIIEQGFYYTFSSVMGLSIFLELGFSHSAMIFVSHDFGHAKLNSYGISGNEKNVQNICNFGKAMFVIYFVIAILTVLLIGYFGSQFLATKSNSDLQWKTEWWLLSLTSGVLLLLTPLLIIVEGAGHVVEIAKYRLIRQIAASVTLAASLFFGLKLYSAPFSNLIAILVSFLALFLPYRRLLLQIASGSLARGWSEVKKTLPYHVKIAGSWACGYFIFGIMIPLTFYIMGAAEAGRVGLSFQIISIVSGAAGVIVTTKVPMMAQLIARGECHDAHRIGISSAIKSVQFSGLAYGCILSGYFFVMNFDHGLLGEFAKKIDSRLVTWVGLLMLMLGEMAKLMTTGIAAYVRLYLVEPYLIFSIIMALMTTGLTYGLGIRFGALGACIGYAATQIVLTPWAWKIGIKNSKAKLA